MKLFLLTSIVGMFLSGCSVFAIGDTSESYCDGECSFKEAGVCADTISIYKHRKQLENRKVKEHWFAEDEDPYYSDSSDGSSFQRINDEEVND